MTREITTSELKKGMVITFNYGDENHTVTAIVDYVQPYDKDNVIIGFHYGKGFENGDKIRECVHEISNKITVIEG